MLKKILSLLLAFTVLLSVVGISSASAAEMVSVKLEGKLPAKGTEAALLYEKAAEKKVPKHLSQKEINQLMATQQNPSFGVGVVKIGLTNQI
ncbi:MAG: hypothetical protein WCC10_09435, partial [Tumebacillaceae bacterium]